MQEREQLTDVAHVKIFSPYRQLRELRGLSQEEAAEIFEVSRRTILEVENCKRDASKRLVRKMDKFYGCKGALIQYWLPKFSANCRGPSEEKRAQKKPQGFWQSLRALAKILLAQL